MKLINKKSIILISFILLTACQPSDLVDQVQSANQGGQTLPQGPTVTYVPIYRQITIVVGQTFNIYIKDKIYGREVHLYQRYQGSDQNFMLFRQWLELNNVTYEVEFRDTGEKWPNLMPKFVTIFTMTNTNTEFKYVDKSFDVVNWREFP